MILGVRADLGLGLGLAVRFSLWVSVLGQRNVFGLVLGLGLWLGLGLGFLLLEGDPWG